jgi:multidrug resistance efflux pump
VVQDNQTVKKGQVLFKIDVSRRALDVEQAKSDLAKEAPRHPKILE